MARPLSKKFEDERLRRLILEATSIEDLRTIALSLLTLKISQEQGFDAIARQWGPPSP